jgi:hypothetical protein
MTAFATVNGMKKKGPPKGNAYYKTIGFDKVVVVPMKKDLYARLKALADKEERTIQATARRILEGRLPGK